MFCAPHTVTPVLRTAPSTTRSLLLVLVLALVWGLMPLASHAEAGADWSIAPAPTDGENGRGEGSLAWILEPGASIEDAVVVTNNSPTSLQLRIAARDAITTSDGHLDLVLDEVPSTGIGAWVSLETETLDIPAGETVTVPFTLTVPEDALPGDYSGGLATSFDGTGTTVSVTYRLSNRVDVRIPGDVTVSHEVSDLQVDMGSTWSFLSPGQATLRYTLTNTGSARLYSNEIIRTSGPLGLFSRATSTTLEEVLPGATVQRIVTVPAWAVGLNSVELTSTSAGVDEQPGTSTTLESDAIAISWSWLLALLAVITLGITLGVLRGRLRARRAASAPTPEASASPIAPVAPVPASASSPSEEAPRPGGPLT